MITKDAAVNTAIFLAQVREYARGIRSSEWGGKTTPQEYEGLELIRCEELKDQAVHVQGRVSFVNHPKYTAALTLDLTDDGQVKTKNTAYLPLEGGFVLVTTAPPILELVQGLVWKTNPTGELKTYKERKSAAGLNLEWKVYFSDELDLKLRVVSVPYKYGIKGEFQSWDLVAAD